MTSIYQIWLQCDGSEKLKKKQQSVWHHCCWQSCLLWTSAALLHLSRNFTWFHSSFAEKEIQLRLHPRVSDRQRHTQCYNNLKNTKCPSAGGFFVSLFSHVWLSYGKWKYIQDLTRQGTLPTLDTDNFKVEVNKCFISCHCSPSFAHQRRGE